MVLTVSIGPDLDNELRNEDDARPRSVHRTASIRQKPSNGSRTVSRVSCVGRNELDEISCCADKGKL